MSNHSVSPVPTDLVFTGSLAIFMIAVAFFRLDGLPGQMIVGFVAVLFAPGYALVAVLFPGEEFSTGRFDDRFSQDSRQITGMERLVLAIGFSVCLVPLFGLGLNFVFQVIWPSTLLSLTGTVTLLLSIVGAFRRRRLSPWDQFNPQIRPLVSRRSERLLTGGERSIISVILVVGFVIAGAGIGVAMLQVDRGEQFTEFAILTENETSGDLVAADYPEEILQNETENVHVSITNNEGETRGYTVIVLLQSFDGEQIQQEQPIDTFEVTVESGETWQESREITPAFTGEDLRVTYLLFAESSSEIRTPGIDTADRHVHFWIDVPT